MAVAVVMCGCRGGDVWLFLWWYGCSGGGVAVFVVYDCSGGDVWPFLWCMTVAVVVWL